MKPTNSTTQGQSNPRKIRAFAIYQILLGWKTNKSNPRKQKLKVALSGNKKLSRVGFDFIYTGNRLQETQPNQILREHPMPLLT